MNKITGMDKMDKTARTMSRTTQQSAHTAMDYALKAQEMNTRLLQRTSQAWIDGFRYQARLSQGMAQVFFGQRGNAFASTTHVEAPVQEQSRSKATEPATDSAQKVTEVAAKDTQKNTEIAAKDTQKAEAQRAEKDAKAEKAEKDAKAEKAETVAKDTRKAEKAAEETQKATEAAAKSAQNSTGAATFPIEGYDEMNVGEVSERLDGLSADELKRVGKYEKDNKDRGSLRKEMKQKIKTAS